MKLTFAEKTIFQEISYLSLSCQRLTNRYLDGFIRQKIFTILINDDWVRKEKHFHHNYFTYEVIEVMFWRKKMNDMPINGEMIVPAVMHTVILSYHSDNFAIRYDDFYNYDNSVLTSESSDLRMYKDISSKSPKLTNKCPSSLELLNPKKILPVELFWKKLETIQKESNIISKNFVE